MVLGGGDEALPRSCGHRAGTVKGFLSSAFKCFLVMGVPLSLGQEHLAWLVEHHLLSPALSLGWQVWVGCACASGLRCCGGGQSWEARLVCPKRGRLAWLCPVPGLRDRVSCRVTASSVHLVCTGLKAPASTSPSPSLGMLVLVCSCSP